MQGFYSSVSAGSSDQYLGRLIHNPGIESILGNLFSLLVRSPDIRNGAGNFGMECRIHLDEVSKTRIAKIPLLPAPHPAGIYSDNNHDTQRR
jgi:hypothetical protein